MQQGENNGQSFQIPSEWPAVSEELYLLATIQVTIVVVVVVIIIIINHHHQ